MISNYVDRGSIRSSLRDSLSTPYRLTKEQWTSRGDYSNSKTFLNFALEPTVEPTVQWNHSVMVKRYRVVVA